LEHHWSLGTLAITAQRVSEFQVALLLAEPPDGFRPDETALEIDGASIDALALRSGDTSIWHREPGAAYRESTLLGRRMEDAGIDRNARLAHGLCGIILALRTAHQQHSDAPIAGISNVRYTSPVFEGATLVAQVEPHPGGTGGFVVTTNQLQPDLAITGRLLYGAVAERHDAAFSSLAEQQLYSLEEAAGMISALIGVGCEEDGKRVLVTGQRLELMELVSIGDTLQVAVEIAARTESGPGERVTATVGVMREGQGGQLVAWGEVTCLIFPPASGAGA
jgi:acyl dehydratase